MIPQARIAIGTGAWLAPNLSGRLFGLDPANNPQSAYLGRLFGARDIALGVGALAASAESRRLWWQMGVACDVLDAAAGALAGRNGSIPKAAAVMVTLTAIGAAVMGVGALAVQD
jgi:hypothetical protein